MMYDGWAAGCVVGCQHNEVLKEKQVDQLLLLPMGQVQAGTSSL